jgi:DNA modification methylase
VTDAPQIPKKTYRKQQADEPAAYLLKNLSSPGDVVLDPFAGVGTYGR